MTAAHIVAWSIAALYFTAVLLACAVACAADRGDRSYAIAKERER